MLGAIVGAYGIPDWIKDKTYSYLDEPLKDVLRRWRQYIKAKNGGRRAIHTMVTNVNEYLRSNHQA